MALVPAMSALGGASIGAMASYLAARESTRREIVRMGSETRRECYRAFFQWHAGITQQMHDPKRVGSGDVSFLLDGFKTVSLDVMLFAGPAVWHRVDEHSRVMQEAFVLASQRVAELETAQESRPKAERYDADFWSQVAEIVDECLGSQMYVSLRGVAEAMRAEIGIR